MHDAVRSSLPERVRRAQEELRSCCACPRCCKVNRLESAAGFCQTGRHARVASVCAHFGEEACLVGSRGSGTIFFSMCNLRCVFCQNWDISQRVTGRAVSTRELADLMLHLQQRGCHNVNLVTPEHVAPQVVEALTVAIGDGLSIPVVYNTSAYDGVSSLRLLDGLIDIYMPDFKFWSRETARRLANAKDYPERARGAVMEMHRQVGDLVLTPDGVACHGLLVRHLVMPGHVDEAAAIFRWLSEKLSPDTFVNIMTQYRPDNLVAAPVLGGPCPGNPEDAFADIARRPEDAEVEAAYEAARSAGLWRFEKRN